MVALRKEAYDIARQQDTGAEMKKDYRKRYDLPEHWILDPASRFGIDYDGYLSVALSMLPSGVKTVIDVGCGDGYASKLLADRGFDVTGVDYSEKAVRYACLIVPQVKFECLDITNGLSHQVLGDSGYDLAFFIEVLEHISPEEHERVLTNISDVLKDEGKLLMSVPTKVRSLHKWHYKHFDEGEIVDLLQKTGFRVLKIAYQHKKSFLFNF